MHWFLDPLEKHYFDFEGRATREQYWMFVLMTFIALVIISVAADVSGLGMYPGAIFQLAILFPSIAIAARRLHDIGRSGWWLLLGFVPFIGGIVLLIMFVLKGEAGSNKYDTVPKPVNEVTSNFIKPDERLENQNQSEDKNNQQ